MNILHKYKIKKTNNNNNINVNKIHFSMFKSLSKNNNGENEIIIDNR